MKILQSGPMMTTTTTKTIPESAGFEKWVEREAHAQETVADENGVPGADRTQQRLASVSCFVVAGLLDLFVFVVAKAVRKPDEGCVVPPAAVRIA